MDVQAVRQDEVTPRLGTWLARAALTTSCAFTRFGIRDDGFLIPQLADDPVDTATWRVGVDGDALELGTVPCPGQPEARVMPPPPRR